MKLYNSLSLEKENFIPRNENEVTIYTCGPTVYNYAHIGNLRTYVSEDILVKTLELFGYNVKRAMNVTDVGHLSDDGDTGEDKMLAGAKREKKTVWQIAEFYTESFFKDMDKLNLKTPDVIEKATDHIDDYIHFINVLEEKGYTYKAGGNVYFDISKLDDYTKLSKMPIDDLKVANRADVSVDDNKKNPFDFVLWFTKSKFENQQMKWDSPYGVGYPGWHLECSVISMVSLGEQIDIHCGGVDHIPVHHTNEIAQSEAYTGKDWVKYWWHGEFLIDKSGKMSKSKGEFLTLDYLIKKGYDPMHYKYFLLSSHYRKQLTFKYESLDNARDSYKKLKAKTLALPSAIKTDKYIDEFKKIIGNDLDTANSLTLIYTVLKDNTLSDGEKRFVIEIIDGVLSLDLFKKEEVDEAFSKTVQELIEKRKEAKEAKNYVLADDIRDELTKMGVEIMDTKEGTTWKML